MKRILQKNTITCKLRLILVIAILFFITFQIASGVNASARRNRPFQSQSQNNPFESALVNSQASFEMKENVDFLLTPALLVQEAISQDVIITYPSE